MAKRRLDRRTAGSEDKSLCADQSKESCGDEEGDISRCRRRHRTFPSEECPRPDTSRKVLGCGKWPQFETKFVGRTLRALPRVYNQGTSLRNLGSETTDYLGVRSEEHTSELQSH